MEKGASATHMTGVKELLSAMSAVNNQDATPETKTPHKTHWQLIFMTCCCLLAIAAAEKGFLYLDTKISTVQSDIGSAVKDLNALKAEVTAANTKGEIVAVTADVEDLKATNTQLLTDVEQIREAFELLKAKKKTVVSAQRKR